MDSSAKPRFCGTRIVELTVERDWPAAYSSGGSMGQYSSEEQWTNDDEFEKVWVDASYGIDRGRPCRLR